MPTKRKSVAAKKRATPILPALLEEAHAREWPVETAKVSVEDWLRMNDKQVDVLREQHAIVKAIVVVLGTLEKRVIALEKVAKVKPAKGDLAAVAALMRHVTRAAGGLNNVLGR